MNMNKKDTHTVQQVEAKLLNELAILKDKVVGKDRKKEAMKNVKTYEKFLRDIDYKEINGKTYKTPRLSWYDDKPMNKKEVLKLIDSVEDRDFEEDTQDYAISHCEVFMPKDGVDLSGVSVGKTRFEFIE
jgi:hypothetical protein